MTVEEASLKGCLLPIGIGGTMVAALGAVWYAQSSGATTFDDAAAPYLNALVAEQWQQAAALDHSSRTHEASDLETAWLDRQTRWGDLTSWSLKVANPGRDPEGPFVHAEVLLTFEELDGPIEVRLRLEPDGDAYRMIRASPAPKVALGESTIW